MTAIIFIAGTLAAIIYIAYQRLFSPLARIPGPFSASLSKWWIVKHTRNGDMHREMIRLHEIHGPLVRTGPNEVSVADPAAFKRIYGSCPSRRPRQHLLTSPGAGSKFRKSGWYGAIQGHRKFDLFAEQDESIHGAQRRLVSRVYSLDNLKSLEPYVNETISHFVGKMHDLQGSRVDMGKWMQLFAFGTADSTLI
jgi:cytochrome P450